MPRAADDGPVVMSVFDRLLDDDPGSTQEARKPRGTALGELRDALRRDLEALLNARPCSTTWSPSFAELDSSILNYGVTTVTSADLSTDDNRERFRAAVERTIQRFEPRFLRVSVSLIDDAERVDRTLRFRIEALVQAKPAPEPIVFDSVLDPSTQGVTVLARARCLTSCTPTTTASSAICASWPPNSPSSIRRSPAGCAFRGEAADDPHVERLLQGFAFIAARIHRKLDDDFPELTQGAAGNPLPALSGADPVDGDRRIARPARPRLAARGDGREP